MVMSDRDLLSKRRARPNRAGRRASNRLGPGGPRSRCYALRARLPEAFFLWIALMCRAKCRGRPNRRSHSGHRMRLMMEPLLALAVDFDVSPFVDTSR